jgi:DegV family protein with EDD domain
MKIGLLTDSTANLHQIPYQHSAVKVIDFSVIIDEVPYTVQTLSQDSFYQKMAASSKLPTTSQGTIMDVVTLLESFKAEGYTDVIVLTISKSLSGSYQNIYMAKQEVEGLQVHLVDSKATEIILGSAVIHAATLIDQGVSVEDIKQQLQVYLDQDGAYFYVDSLKNLVKGGRISGASGMIGEALKVKPILELDEEGRIELKEKNRTKAKSLDRLVMLYQEKVGDHPHDVFFLSSDNPDEVKAFSETLRLGPNVRSILYSPLTPIVAAHTGPGMIGIGWRILP